MANMRWKLLAAWALCLGVSSQAMSGAVISTPDEQALARIKADLGRTLKDPGSAQYLGIVVVEPTEPTAMPGLACGWVNAKNAFGGYVGFKPFFVLGERAVTRDDGPRAPLNNQSLFAVMWRMCHPETEERFGSTVVALPQFDHVAECAKKSKVLGRPFPNCESGEADAVRWLQDHPTSPAIAALCEKEGRERKSALRSRMCVEESELELEIQRGPPAE